MLIKIEGMDAMLIGKKCKVGNNTKHEREDFSFYTGVICSEAQLAEGDDDFRILVMSEGKLLTADTHFIYDVE